MAVKTRGAAPGAPRPRAGADRQRAASAWYVRIAAVVLVAVIAMLAVILLGGGAPAAEQREFDQALFEAQRDFLKHFDPGAETNLLNARARFIDGELSADELESLAETWERDFAAARDAVRELDPNTGIDVPTPEDLIQATWFIAEGLEAWRGVAVMYPAAAGLRRALEDASGAVRATLDEQLDELLIQIQAWQVRASNLHEMGVRQIHGRRQELGINDGPQLRPAAEEEPDGAGSQP